MPSPEDGGPQGDIANDAETVSEMQPRKAWTTPKIRRLAAGDASAGIQIGPEIVVLLS